MFGRRKPAPLDAASRMGFRSKLVLAKLGYDLRQHYDAVLEQDFAGGAGAAGRSPQPGRTDAPDVTSGV
jgi:hypothetical protein